MACRKRNLIRPVIWPATVFDCSPKLHSADLIISDTEGGAGDKGKEAIVARLDMLGVTLNSIQMVPHDAASIAAAITTSQADLVMILSGSATSDWADVAPTAVSQAGGDVHRFGMPVDPEFIVPWSHRAKTRNRFARMRPIPCIERADWVLSRVVWFDVMDADFAQMAIGGLLKEIPTRPQPRRPKSRTK